MLTAAQIEANTEAFYGMFLQWFDFLVDEEATEELKQGRIAYEDMLTDMLNIIAHRNGASISNANDEQKNAIITQYIASLTVITAGPIRKEVTERIDSQVQHINITRHIEGVQLGEHEILLADDANYRNYIIDVDYNEHHENFIGYCRHYAQKSFESAHLAVRPLPRPRNYN